MEAVLQKVQSQAVPAACLRPQRALLVLEMLGTAEARALNNLHERFVAATHQLHQAEKAAGATGIDTTADAQAAMNELDQIEKELKELRAKTSAPEEIGRIDEILDNIQKIRRH